MTDKAWEFLKPLYAYPPKDRVHVTLTYAQSLDGLIAGSGGKQIKLSSNESMTMTHRMRLHMDGIIIGVNTLINDSPRLTAREEYVDKHIFKSHSQPTPIVLDSKLRSPVQSSLIKNAEIKAGKTPIIFTTVDRYDEEYAPQWLKLEQAGYHIYSVDADREGHVDLGAVLRSLKAKGMQYVMIEGGAGIIKHCISNNYLLDALVVTVAPTYIGTGVSICSQTGFSGLHPYPHLTQIRYEQFGRDIVMSAAMASSLKDSDNASPTSSV